MALSVPGFDFGSETGGPLSDGVFGRLHQGIYSLRIETCDLLLKQAGKNLLVGIFAVPRSGKSALCQLLWGRARASPAYRTEWVYYVNCASVGGGTSFEEVFEEYTKMSFWEARKSPPVSPAKPGQAGKAAPREHKLIILDEAQKTYEGCIDLWDWLKGHVLKPAAGVHVIIVASRGSNPGAQGMASTPLEFETDNRVPMSPRPGKVEAALQFPVEEFDEVYQRFREVIGMGQHELKVLQSLIEETTERYPGSVMHTLDRVPEQYSPSNHSAEEWEGLAVAYLASQKYLDSFSSSRSFMREDVFIQSHVGHLMGFLLAKGEPVSLEELKRQCAECHTRAKELGRAGHLLLERNEVSFPSQLHRDLCRTQLERSRYASSAVMPQNIIDFLKVALARMSSTTLRETINTSIQGHVREAQLDCEFYRAVYSLLPPNVYLSPSVGTVFGLRAFVDKVLMPQKWAFELLVDGQGLREHERRFEQGGRYEPLLNAVQLVAWVVVDFRNPQAPKPQEQVRSLATVFVVFEHGFGSAKIRHGQDEYVVYLKQ